MHHRGTILLVSSLLVLSACAGGGDAGNGTGGDAGVRPNAGGFGGGVEGDATFLVTLVVFQSGSDVVDVVSFGCAPTGTIDPLNSSITVGTDVPITDGRFSAESADVRIEGAFVSPERAEGQIQALSPDAQSCGVPESGTWTADCESMVKETGEGGFTLESGGCGVLEP